MRRLLRPSTTPSADGAIRRIAVSKASFPAGYVRLSTRPLKRVPFPCSSSEYRRQVLPVSFGAQLCQRSCRGCSRTSVYAPPPDKGAFAFCIQMTPSDNEQFFADGTTRRSPSSQSARVRRRASLCGGRLACRAVAPLRVVKMRRRSLRSSFLWNYREALSFSLRVDTSG